MERQWIVVYPRTREIEKQKKKKKRKKEERELYLSLFLQGLWTDDLLVLFSSSGLNVESRRGWVTSTKVDLNKLSTRTIQPVQVRSCTLRCMLEHRSCGILALPYRCQMSCVWNFVKQRYSGLQTPSSFLPSFLPSLPPCPQISEISQTLRIHTSLSSFRSLLFLRLFNFFSLSFYLLANSLFPSHFHFFHPSLLESKDEKRRTGWESERQERIDGKGCSWPAGSRFVLRRLLRSSRYFPLFRWSKVSVFPCPNGNFV